MYRETNPLIAALIAKQEGNNAVFINKYDKFQYLKTINKNFVVLYKLIKGKYQYFPMIIYSIPFIQFCKINEAQNFLRNNPKPELLTHTADKLKWYRYKNSLLQQDVAMFAGIDRNTYVSYEQNNRDYYSIDVLKRISLLFDTNIENLLDEYNMFLFKGQGQQIVIIRKRLGLTQFQFGHLMGVSVSAVQRWEKNQAVISKSTWQKLLKL